MEDSRKPDQAGEGTSQKRLGDYLATLRRALRLTLRDVEEASGVSNPYLSQLENDRITKPSPHILHKLANVYRVPYEVLMEKAGYITRGDHKPAQKHRRRGRVAASALEELSPEEEEEILKYLAFLRSRRTKG